MRVRESRARWRCRQHGGAGGRLGLTVALGVRLEAECLALRDAPAAAAVVVHVGAEKHHAAAVAAQLEADEACGRVRLSSRAGAPGRMGCESWVRR